MGIINRAAEPADDHVAENRQRGAPRSGYPVDRACVHGGRAHIVVNGASPATHLSPTRSRFAAIVAEIDIRPETICAALLHDTVVDTDYSRAGLTEDFGEVVAHLVDGVTELDRDKRKIVLAMARDPRVLVLKLVDRLHNMRTMRFLPPMQQARKSKETLEVPLAHQPGMATIKRELEDLASGIFHPKVVL